jgi:hypothetical protein
VLSTISRRWAASRIIGGSGESEHDLKLDWGKVELLRPSLEMLSLVPRKARQDRFRGLMLVPCWPKQNWDQQIQEMSVLSCGLAPDPRGTGKWCRATLLAFSPAAISMASRHGWLMVE